MRHAPPHAAPDAVDARLGGDPLAEGLALHLERWALALGADAALARQIAAIGRALSRAARLGHVGLPLAQALPEDERPALQALLGCGVVGTPAAPGAYPLILDDEGRIYLHRDFALERRLAQRLVRAARLAPQSLQGAIPSRLRALFGDRENRGGDAAPDWQQLATALALRQRLVVISGGPGTGKTSTVVKLLACLLADAPDARIALTAPTGKAAARLAEAVGERAAALPAALRERLPQSASTVHRLLGVTPQGFVHHAGRPLPIDVLIVDEASMLDLALATQLLEAVPARAHIVLLGDQHQLAAVESGAVFAELAADPGLSDACRSALETACELAAGSLRTPAPLRRGVLPDSVVWFERNYRFAADSAIGRLAAQIRTGDREAALATLHEAAHAAAVDGELQWWDETGAAPTPALRRAWLQGYEPYLQALRQGPGQASLQDPVDVAALAQAFARFRVLCAHREGARGMGAVNAVLDAHARRALAAMHAEHPGPPGGDFYVGRPVMVLKNQPLLQLFNGDIGITLPPAPGESGLVVAFPQPGGELRRIPVQRLPEHQSAWAMTVHKAQGSEFDAVLVLLPDAASPVLTRELLYTALTRARRRVALAGSAAVVATAIATPTRRHSGLLARLREALADSSGSSP